MRQGFSIGFRRKGPPSHLPCRTTRVPSKRHSFPQASLRHPFLLPCQFQGGKPCRHKKGPLARSCPLLIVPDEDESVVIAEEGATEATAISTEQVKFNYVGAWTISAKAEAEWLSVAYDAANNCLTYTAEANTGAKRETKVTITASMEGKESLTWSFSVLQKERILLIPSGLGLEVIGRT